MNALSRRGLALALALFVLAGCSRLDPVGTDLRTLNQTAQAAMASANVQDAMARLQSASTPAEKAAILRESSATIGRAQADLLKVEMHSEEVRAIQSRMVSGFGKLSTGARSAADAFERSASDDLARAREQMRDGQVEFIAAGQAMVDLARRRSVDLTTKP